MVLWKSSSFPINLYLGRKPLPNRRNHPAQPKNIQHLQGNMTAKVQNHQPPRKRSILTIYHHLWTRIELRIVGDVESVPNIFVDVERGICSPDQATTKKDGNKGEAVVKLGFRASHAEFIEEPVNIQKRC